MDAVELDDDRGEPGLLQLGDCILSLGERRVRPVTQPAAGHLVKQGGGADAHFAGAAFWLRWDLALVVFATVPVLVLLTRRFSAGFRDAAQAERSRNGAIGDVVAEGVAQVTLIQASGTENAEAARLHLRGDAWLRARLAQMRLAAVYSPLTKLFEPFGILAVLGVRTWLMPRSPAGGVGRNGLGQVRRRRQQWTPVRLAGSVGRRFDPDPGSDSDYARLVASDLTLITIHELVDELQ